MNQYRDSYQDWLPHSHRLPAEPVRNRRYYAPLHARSRRRAQRIRRTYLLVGIALLLAGVLMVGNMVSCLSEGASQMGLVAPQSTPESEWQAGQLPYLYQIDEQWADEPYAGGTIAKNGCGPTALAMVYVYFTGATNMGPVEMCAFAEREGYSQDGATLWSFMTEGAAQLGLHSEELPADPSRVISELRAGHPVICIMGPGDFTTTGHFIVLSGVDDEGNVTVHDANSAANSAKSWDVEDILAQCRCLWAFS